MSHPPGENSTQPLPLENLEASYLLDAAVAAAASSAAARLANRWLNVSTVPAASVLPPLPVAAATVAGCDGCPCPVRVTVAPAAVKHVPARTGGCRNEMI